MASCDQKRSPGFRSRDQGSKARVRPGALAKEIHPGNKQKDRGSGAGLLIESSTLRRQVSGAGQSPDVQAKVHLPEEQETPSEKREASQEGVSLPCLGKLFRTWKWLEKHSWKY